jgi:hypothetical protein
MLSSSSHDASEAAAPPEAAAMPPSTDCEATAIFLAASAAAAAYTLGAPPPAAAALAKPSPPPSLPAASLFGRAGAPKFVHFHSNVIKEVNDPGNPDKMCVAMELSLANSIHTPDSGLKEEEIFHIRVSSFYHYVGNKFSLPRGFIRLQDAKGKVRHGWNDCIDVRRLLFPDRDAAIAWNSGTFENYKGQYDGMPIQQKKRTYEEFISPPLVAPTSEELQCLGLGPQFMFAHFHHRIIQKISDPEDKTQTCVKLSLTHVGDKRRIVMSSFFSYLEKHQANFGGTIRLLTANGKVCRENTSDERTINALLFSHEHWAIQWSNHQKSLYKQLTVLRERKEKEQKARENRRSPHSASAGDPSFFGGAAAHVRAASPSSLSASASNFTASLSKSGESDNFDDMSSSSNDREESPRKRIKR